MQNYWWRLFQKASCALNLIFMFYRKSLKIPNGQSESVYWRTDNTMAKRQKNRQHNGQKTEEQTTQWPKEKVQKDEQRSTKHTHKTKDRITRTGGELRCSGRVGSSCSTSGTHRVNLVTNHVISREWGKDRELFTTNRRYPCLFVTKIFHNGQRSHGGDRKYHYIIFC
jgi:hypothetical protein